MKWCIGGGGVLACAIVLWSNPYLTSTGVHQSLLVQRQVAHRGNVFIIINIAERPPGDESWYQVITSDGFVGWTPVELFDSQDHGAFC